MINTTIYIYQLIIRHLLILMMSERLSDRSSAKKNLLNILKLSDGFSRLSIEERRVRLLQMEFISKDDINILRNESALSNELLSTFIENAIGSFPIPIGVAIGFVIDERDYIIPMATEESSVIAAASKTAKWIRENGKIKTENISHLAVGQIQIPRINNHDHLNKIIKNNKENLIIKVNKTIAVSLVKRSGGLKDIELRILPRGDGFQMGVIHLLVDTCDAMGANIINQICEFLKPEIETLTHEKVGICIVSNLADKKLTLANIVINNVDPQLGESIEEASLFAQIDSYRAATNNKGIMNGIDSVLLATGNDCRAVEAGLHAYASRSGKYSSISRWFMKGNDLHGELIGPIVVGIVGGMTHLHPTAKLCLKMLNVKSANELSRIVAAVGLVQNLGALKALVTEGIVKGHMKLHLSNLILSAGATKEEIPILRSYILDLLLKNGHVTEGDAKAFIKQIRKKHLVKTEEEFI